MKNLTPFILLLACVTTHAQTTGFSGTGDNIDVVYHRCNWRINPDSATKAIKGTVTTYFVTKKANVSVITFDLRKSAFNNANLSVRYHNNPITFSFPAGANSNTLTITLPTPLAINKLDSVSITYGGSPPAVNVAAQGYQVGTDATSGQKYVNTLSESYEDRDWWPCKADMQDKVDSMDIIVNVPWTGADTFWVATNGKLIDSTIAGGSRTFTYKTRYPIASYLVSVAVARYNRYYRNVVVGGTTVPIAFYLIRGKTNTTYTSILTGMDQMTTVLTAFNARYGDYPFKKEKHGYYEGLQGAAGMEHQTFSAIASGSLTSLSTLVHELAHQWFGDNVSFSTWNHLWLAEGFAKYSESLAAELVPALGLNPLAMRASVKATALSTATTPVQLSNASITTSNTIWTTANDNAVYQRGAMVVSMLRALVGDTKFFQALKNYQSDPLLANKSATTTDLKNHFEAVTGWDMDPFFNDWVLGTGNPNYTGANSINWGYNSSTKRFAVQVMGQSRSAGSTVSYFHTPIVLRLQGSTPAQDTTITFYDQNGVLSYAGNGISGTVTGGIISFNVSFKPVTVTFDAFSQLLANGATVNLVALPVKIKDFTLTKGNATNTLNLSVYNDDNSLRSIVLQRSTDGIHFSDVEAMTKKGEESTLLHYTYTDLFPYDGATFYRAKIIEYDRESYTTILRADYNYEGSGVVSPNPATNQVTIRWKRGIHTQPSVVSITDISGRLIKQQQVSTSTITINVSSLAAGTYTVSVKEGDRISLLDKLAIVR